MRGRILNHPEFIDRVNQTCVPVEVNVTDQGFPKGVPGLKMWEQAIRYSAWTNLAFGKFIILDAETTQYLGFSHCSLEGKTAYHDAHDALEKGMNRFERLINLREAVADSSTARADSYEKIRMLEHEMSRELAETLPCFLDHRLHTARYVVSPRLTSVIEALRMTPEGRPGKVTPRVHRLAVRALGTFLLDDRPFPPEGLRHLETFYSFMTAEEKLEMEEQFEKMGEKNERPRDFTSLPIPVPMRRRSAFILGQITNQNWSTQDPQLLEKALAWWAAHREDPGYAID